MASTTDLDTTHENYLVAACTVLHDAYEMASGSPDPLLWAEQPAHIRLIECAAMDALLRWQLSRAGVGEKD